MKTELTRELIEQAFDLQLKIGDSPRLDAARVGAVLARCGPDDVVIADANGRYTTQLGNECPGVEAHIRPTGQLLFEGLVEVIGKLGLRRIDRPFAFAAGAQAVPLTVTEFPVAALSFPIIFAGDRRQPLAVMGVSGDANMFIQPNGYFEAGVYVPAYIRRYPFVLANDSAREQLEASGWNLRAVVEKIET